MQMVQGQEDVGCVKPSSIFFESAYLRQVEEELAARAVFEYEEQFAITLECVIHFDDKRVPDIFLQNLKIV